MTLKGNARLSGCQLFSKTSEHLVLRFHGALPVCLHPQPSGTMINVFDPRILINSARMSVFTVQNEPQL